MEDEIQCLPCPEGGVGVQCFEACFDGTESGVSGMGAGRAEESEGCRIHASSPFSVCVVSVGGSEMPCTSKAPDTAPASASLEPSAGTSSATVSSSASYRALDPAKTSSSHEKARRVLLSRNTLGSQGFDFARVCDRDCDRMLSVPCLSTSTSSAASISFSPATSSPVPYSGRRSNEALESDALSRLPSLAA